jgi:hypothetical protein
MVVGLGTEILDKQRGNMIQTPEKRKEFYLMHEFHPCNGPLEPKVTHTYTHTHTYKTGTLWSTLKFQRCSSHHIAGNDDNRATVGITNVTITLIPTTRRYKSDESPACRRNTNKT